MDKRQVNEHVVINVKQWTILNTHTHIKSIRKVTQNDKFYLYDK